MKKHILQENYERMFGSIKEGWFDNMGNAAKQAYIQKFPNSKFAKNTKKKADDKKGKESSHQKELDTLSKDIKNLKGAVDHTQDKGDWAANRNWRDKLEKSQKQWMKLKGKGPDESINISDKLEEGWWDNMGDAAKKSYIKKHGSAPNVAGDDDYDMGEVPGSRELDDTPEDDSEKGSSLTSAPGRVPDEDGGDEDDYDMGVVPGSRELDDTPEDDSEKGSSLTSAPGRVPDEDDEDDWGKKPDGDEPKGELPTKMQNAVDELEYLSDPEEFEGWLDDNQRKLMGGKIGRGGQIEVDKFVKALHDMEDSYNDDDEYNDQMQNFKGMVDKAMDRYRKKSESIAAQHSTKKRAGRTGNELNQETLTIDGKQFRRMSEGVEQKPKYEFSEFYERFKR